jgi:hypothetical protein
MTPIETINKALVDSVRLSVEYPNFQPLESVKAQLQYLKNILDGDLEDRSRLNEITIGIYAAREFEERDMTFANILYDVESIVDQLRSGKL